jgi:hypothetical protein
MKKTSILVLIVALVFTFFGSASAEDKGVGILIKCSPITDTTESTFVIPASATIQAQQIVGFRLNTSGLNSCFDSVKVMSNPPIGNFNLTQSNPFKTITFPSAGIDTYRVTSYSTAGADTALGTITVTPLIPTLTQWGVIILVALLILSAIYIMLKRRKATVPA